MRWHSLTRLAAWRQKCWRASTSGVAALGYDLTKAHDVAWQNELEEGPSGLSLGTLNAALSTSVSLEQAMTDIIFHRLIDLHVTRAGHH